MEVPESGGTPAFVKKKVIYVNFNNMGGDGNPGNTKFFPALFRLAPGCKTICRSSVDKNSIEEKCVQSVSEE